MPAPQQELAGDTAAYAYTGFALAACLKLVEGVCLGVALTATLYLFYRAVTPSHVCFFSHGTHTLSFTYFGFSSLLSHFVAVAPSQV